jgi:hypothetical protein
MLEALKNFLRMMVTIIMDHLDLPHNLIFFPEQISTEQTEYWMIRKEFKREV